MGPNLRRFKNVFLEGKMSIRLQDKKTQIPDNKLSLCLTRHALMQKCKFP